MKRLLLSALVLVGCADDSKPQFDLVSCTTGGTCQRACNSQAAQIMDGPRCTNASTVRNGNREDHYLCPGTFEWNGLQGCCMEVNDGAPDDIEYFFQCE